MGVLPPRTMKLAAFLGGDSNYHLAGWRHPDAWTDAGSNFTRWLQLARQLEAAKFHMMFIADYSGVPDCDNAERLSRSPRADRFDPMMLLAALAATTSKLGLVATVATTYAHPFAVARQFASLDLLSQGRAGWNIVTGGNAADAVNFSADIHPASHERYARGEEFVDVVTGLWSSFEEDAFIRDKASGVYVDPAKVHTLNHHGTHFSVKGPLSVARSPQGRPLLVQAGQSLEGRRLSARIADVIFTAQGALKSALQFAEEIGETAIKFGRTRQNILIMPGVTIHVAESDSEARQKRDRLDALIDPDIALANLGQLMGGVDLSGFDRDGLVPDIPGNAARASAAPAFVKIARGENLTLQQLALRATGAKAHLTLIGTPRQIVDEMAEWFHSGAADGFNILPTHVPGGLTEVIELVLPELRRRGLFQSSYTGATLRERLQLS